MQNELKPCPFCGGEVTHIFTSHKTLQNRDYHYSCQKCGAIIFLPCKSKYKSSEQIEKEAIETWNKRTANVMDYNKELSIDYNKELSIVGGKQNVIYGHWNGEKMEN